MSTSLDTRSPAALERVPRRLDARGAAVERGEPRFRALAIRLRRRSDLLRAEAIGSLHARADAAATRAPSAAALARVEELIRRVLVAQLRHFESAASTGRLDASELISGSVLAEAGEFELVLFALRATHLSLWDAWFALVEGEVDLTAPERRALLARGSDLFFSYANLLSGKAVESFRLESEGLRLAPGQREARVFRALLAGDPLAAASLRFDFERHHLGLIAWDGEDPLAALTDLARALARPLFTLRPGECAQECWGWISGTRALSAREEDLIVAWRPARGRLAVGLEGFGETGFCATHRQAERARRLIAPGCPALCRYDDVVVEALATENEADARAFVAHELRGIDDDSLTSVRLRETLLAYFRSEQNAASAGASLGVHQQTVANRLRATEERLGHVSIGARRVELELALRLHGRLGGDATEPVARRVGAPPTA